MCGVVRLVDNNNNGCVLFFFFFNICSFRHMLVLLVIRARFTQELFSRLSTRSNSFSSGRRDDATARNGRV